MNQVRAVALGAVVLLASCSGATPLPSGSRAPGNPTGPSGPGTLGVKMSIPVAASSQSRSVRPEFIVAGTDGVTIVLEKSGTSTAVASASFDVSSGSSLCTTSGSSRTCTLAIPAPSGAAYDAIFTSYDQKPSNGAIPAAAHQLAKGTVFGVAIVPGTLTNISVTLDGTPFSFVTEAVAVLGDFGAVSSAIALNVQDATGATIVGAYSSPVTASVRDTGAHTTLAIGGGSKAASTQISSSAAASSLVAYYDGRGGSGYSATLSYGATGATNASATFNTFTTTATATFGETPTYTIPSGATAATAAFSAPSQQLSIVAAETNFSGTFTLASTNCSGIATIARSGSTFAVTSSTFGTCKFTISDGHLTYPVSLTSNVTSSSIVIPPPDGTIVEFAGAPLSSNFSPNAIAVGSDGALWFTVLAQPGHVPFVGRITTLGAMTSFALPSGAKPQDITSGSDGRLWVVDVTGKLYAVTTAGTVSSVVTGASSGAAITSGPDGNLWFTDPTGKRIVSIHTNGTGVQTYAISAAGTLADIASGPGNPSSPSGNIWFTDSQYAQIGRMTLTGGTVQYYPIGSLTGATSIALGADGAMWFAQATGIGAVNGVGRLDGSGQFSSYIAGYAPDASQGMTLGPDNALYFGGCVCSLGKITTGGSFSTFQSGGSGNASDAVAGPDGGIWFTDVTNNAIGRLQP